MDSLLKALHYENWFRYGVEFGLPFETFCDLPQSPSQEYWGWWKGEALDRGYPNVGAVHVLFERELWQLCPNCTKELLPPRTIHQERTTFGNSRETVAEDIVDSLG